MISLYCLWINQHIWMFQRNSPISSVTLCLSDSAWIWLSRAAFRDKEAQQRSRVRVSALDSGCGRSVSQSACLFTLSAVPRCISAVLSICTNMLSWAAFTPNLEGDHKNTFILDWRTEFIWCCRTFQLQPVSSWRQNSMLQLYLRCLQTADAALRNSLMNGRGRHFTVDEEVLTPSFFFSFSPRLVNQSTQSRSTMEHSSCCVRILSETSNSKHHVMTSFLH